MKYFAIILAALALCSAPVFAQTGNQSSTVGGKTAAGRAEGRGNQERNRNKGERDRGNKGERNREGRGNKAKHGKHRKHGKQHGKHHGKRHGGKGQGRRGR
jgi:hypothetical protein